MCPVQWAGREKGILQAYVCQSIHPGIPVEVRWGVLAINLTEQYLGLLEGDSKAKEAGAELGGEGDGREIVLSSCGEGGQRLIQDCQHVYLQGNSKGRQESRPKHPCHRDLGHQDEG